MFQQFRRKHSRSIVFRAATLLFFWVVAAMVLCSAGGVGSSRSELTESKDPVEKQESQRELATSLRTAHGERRGRCIAPRICVLRMPSGASPSPIFRRPSHQDGHRFFNGLLAPLRC
jgi:hypothetical protein